MALFRDDLADMEDERTKKTMIRRAICDSVPGARTELL